MNRGGPGRMTFMED